MNHVTNDSRYQRAAATALLIVLAGCGDKGDGRSGETADTPRSIDDKTAAPESAAKTGSAASASAAAGVSSEGLEGRRDCRVDTDCVAMTYGSEKDLCCVADPRPVPLSKPFYDKWVKFRSEECKDADCPPVVPTEPPVCSHHAVCMRSNCVNYCDWGPTALPGTFAAPPEHLFLIMEESLKTLGTSDPPMRARFEIDGDRMTVERSLPGVPPARAEATLTPEQLETVRKKIADSGLLAEEDRRLPSKRPGEQLWSFGIRVESPGKAEGLSFAGPMPGMGEAATSELMKSKVFHRAKDLIADLGALAPIR